MNICPITYEQCEGKYSSKGLNKLSRSLEDLEDFPYSAAEQLQVAATIAPKMSIQGVQPKLSAVLKPRHKRFSIVEAGGRYILKPQNPQFPYLPENEDLSMRLASAAGIEAPLHGLFYSKDRSMTYFIKRFDRAGKKKVAVEDFSQLLGLSRDTKYDTSMEKIAAVVKQYCTFPAVENVKLFKLTLINFLIGNEDMHAKNFSLITRAGKVELAPAYDILNTSIVLSDVSEEIALPVKGKKSKLGNADLIDYYGRERLGLNSKLITNSVNQIRQAIPAWQQLIDISFLPEEMKAVYKKLLKERSKKLFI
ncbi:MAG: HipA domain-containing protein [Desulfobacterales bacterium]|nr:HipA domain-containing protein [Desulfobacterales bacterium]